MNKLALIIGNGIYPESPLKNPVNDAEAIKLKLDNLGFTCLLCKDATNQQMEEHLKDFGAYLSENEVGLFFFAGHGMQIQGKNYLTAINTNFDKEIDAKYSSLPLDKVIEVMEAGSNLTNIIILDACRNNPYERKWRGTDSLGLAPVYAPKGMIIAYATSPGQYASDGRGQNGAYTSALLQHIAMQDITIEDLFKRVRNTLSSSTGGRQISWEHTSLMGDFYFNYSILTDELVSEYSINALADSENNGSPKSPLRKVITSLKSHDWDLQNPAIKKIPTIDLSLCEKDDLFLLGRNLYQTGCGPSFEAQAYFDNLPAKLSKIQSVAAFHILNGTLYEIYFDSNGRIRNRFKTERFEDVFSLEGDEHFASSFNFIRQALKPYMKQLFYLPGTLRNIVIDMTTEILEEDKRAVAGIFYEGENILYDEEGKSYFNPHEDRFLRTYTVQEIKAMLCKGLVIPKSQLTLNYIDKLGQGDPLLGPYEFNLQKYSK
jgi:hypothetical protein